jgi:hypothetical protein
MKDRSKRPGSKHLDLHVRDLSIKTLFQQLTFLPLAIAQAAAYINETGIGLLNYVSLLKEQQDVSIPDA